MKIKRALVSAFTALMLALGLAVVATPAQAAWQDCDRGSSCLWNSTSYPGSPDASFVQFVNLTANATIKSVANRGNTCNARFYEKTNFKGESFFLYHEGRQGGGQWRDPNLSNGTEYTSENWSNRVRSGQFVCDENSH